MANRLKTLFFVLVLAAGVFSGTPLRGGEARDKVCPMKCCQKKKAGAPDPQKTETARYLCRVFMCPKNMPVNTGQTIQTNLAPVIIASERVSLFEILFSTTPKADPAGNFNARRTVERNLPFYLRHQRILI